MPIDKFNHFVDVWLDSNNLYGQNIIPFSSMVSYFSLLFNFYHCFFYRYYFYRYFFIVIIIIVTFLNRYWFIVQVLSLLFFFIGLFYIVTFLFRYFPLLLLFYIYIYIYIYIYEKLLRNYCCLLYLIARLSQRVWVTTPRGTVNQELKLSPTHLLLKW